MATTSECEMMSQCCGAEGKFDFAKMKGFMKSCGKKEFSEDELEQIEQLCSDHGDICERMMKFMKSCGCSCE